MSEPAGWEVLARFAARWEAEVLLEALRAADIPAVLSGPETGIFGPGFAGGTSRGVEVRVPFLFRDEAIRIRRTFAPDAPGPEPDDPPPDAA
ncbi:MAG: hypothetical protein RRA92_02930 [Gemmatimonadota bacterium]|nr:hypothetical protein [Gemmatimonadota bacterium]